MKNETKTTQPATVKAPRHIDVDFGMVVHHTTSFKVGLQAVDEFLFSETAEVKNGDIVAVEIVTSDEMTTGPLIRRFYYDDQSKRIMLTVDDMSEAPLVFDDQDRWRVRIMGKAVSASCSIDRMAEKATEALQKEAEAGAAAIQQIADEADTELKKHINPIWDRPPQST